MKKTKYLIAAIITAGYVGNSVAQSMNNKSTTATLPAAKYVIHNKTSIPIAVEMWVGVTNTWSYYPIARNTTTPPLERIANPWPNPTLKAKTIGDDEKPDELMCEVRVPNEDKGNYTITVSVINGTETCTLS